MISLYVIPTILLVLFVLAVALNRAVVWTAQRADILDCNEALPDGIAEREYDCILVLGAGVRPDGTPSPMLEDRLRGAVALYKSGAVGTVVLSGDNSGEHYNEVLVMANYCIEHGVDASDIVRDDIGFSTFETAYNAVITMGYESMIVVTQRYHLYRAMYVVKKLGASADGFATDYRKYRLQLKYSIREYAARCKDFLKVNLSLQS